MRKKMLALLVVAAPMAANANLIVNGGFEDLGAGSLNASGWNYFATIPGWVPDPANAGLEIGRESVYGVNFTSATNLVMELDTRQNIKATQGVAGVQAGKAYTLTFSYAQRAGTSDATNGFKVTFGGSTFTFNAATYDTNAKTYSAVVVATGNSNLTFEALGTSDSFGTLVDNVSLTAVPGPAAALPMLLGMASALRRRSKKA